MKTILIKTQKELDALPYSFDDFTVIEIRSEETITVSKAWDSSRVEARGSSRVEAWDSSRVEAYDSSRVEARGSSRVEAWGSSSVVARGSARVEAWGSSSVVAWGSSRVEAWGSSRVEARDSSRVEAYDSSSVVAYDFSFVAVLRSSVAVKKLWDYSVASFRDIEPKIEKQADTATVIKTPQTIERTFDEWLEQGYVHADGITKKLLSRKTLGEIEVFEVEEFIKNKSSYVVRRGDTFSHGETVEQAIQDLRYKISDRDTSEFKAWKLEDEKPLDELIVAYRVITGACAYGTKQFVESNKLPEKMKVKTAIMLTKGKFGYERFKEFWR